MKSDEPQLQLPQYSPDGYIIKAANDEHVLLVPGGDYKNLIFSEVDFSQITIKADFSFVKFRHCNFDKTDLSGSTLSSAHWVDCTISQSAMMWCNLSDSKFTQTSVEDTRFAFSNLSRTKFADSFFRECNFRDTQLSSANVKNSTLVDCEFMSTVAPDVLISECCLYRLNIKKSNFPGLHVRDSAIEALAIMDSNLSGSSWSGVTSESGHWIVSRTDFTAAYFSLCDVKNSSWRKTFFVGVVMERSNWFRNHLTKCHFEMSTMNSVGWNETKFTQTRFINLKASALRLRFADFDTCSFQDSFIADSAFEYSRLWSSEAINFDVLRPTWCLETRWHAGFAPDTQPHSTDHPKNN